MKILVPILFFLLCVRPSFCTGQDVYDIFNGPVSSIDSAIAEYTDSLLADGFDTTISFSCQSCFGTGLYDENSNVIEDAFLVVAFSNKKMEIIKFIFGRIDSLDIYGIGKSKKIELKNEDTLQLFRTLTKPSEEEDLAPYIYQVKYNGYVSYYPLRYSHTVYNSIDIKSKKHKRYLRIEVNSVQEKSNMFDAPTNLNFEYNKRLNLYSLHNLLINISTRAFDFQH